MRSAVILTLVAATAGVASILAQGPVPGDLTLTAAFQDVLGTGAAWARLLTDTAKAPLVWATAGLAAILAWRVAGWRGALAVPLGYAFAFAADKGLRAVLHVPRPDPEQVFVFDPATSSGLPSAFGLVYGALFGAALLARGPARRARPVRIIAAVLLVAGASARIVMGGHWGSQMLASTALGLLLAAGALAIVRRLPGPRHR